MYHQIKNEMDKIKLTDVQKMQMWETLAAEDVFAQRKRTRVPRRYGMQVAAALLIGVLILGGVGTGVCYATTGSSPAKIIGALFTDSDSDAVTALDDSYRTSGESIVYENIRYTLEGYCYDKDNHLLMAQVCMETTDGSPLLDWDVAYAVAGMYEMDVAENYENAAAWQEACESGAESYESYGAILSYMIDLSGIDESAGLGEQGQDFLAESELIEKWENSEGKHVFATLTLNGATSWTDTLQAVSASKAYHMVMSAIPADASDQEGNADFELTLGDAETDIKTFELEDTGEMPNLTVNCPDVTSFQIFGSGFILLANETDFTLDSLEIVLKDGTDYYYGEYDGTASGKPASDSAYSVGIGTDEDGNASVTEQDVFGEEMSEKETAFWEGKKSFQSVGATTDGDGMNRYGGNFESYIDVEDVVAVYVNGVECAVK